MNQKRAKILQTALGQLGNHDHQNPEPGLYYTGGYNWCAEFVSWVYNEAGYPFDKGSFSSRVNAHNDNGEWMQRTTERIVKWFKERNQYVHRHGPGWYNLIPKPGDFVFIGRKGTDRMHSGLVQYLSCSGSLHTIEGNNAGRKVMQFEYPLYQINETDNGLSNGVIMGIGVLS